MPHLMATMKNVKEDIVHHPSTISCVSEEKRKRKMTPEYSVDQSLECKTSLSKRMKKENGSLMIKKELDIPCIEAGELIIKSEGFSWQCGIPNNEADGLRIEDCSFEDRDCFQECDETWILDTNGDICYSKPREREQSTGTIIDNFQSSLPSGSCGYPSPNNADSDTSQLGLSDDNDEELNLSWLLNFNVESLFKPDDLTMPALRHDHSMHSKMQAKAEKGVSRKGSAPSQSSANVTQSKQLMTELKSMAINQAHAHIHPVNGGNGLNAMRKPPFTYSDLIERSLKESGELTVSGIYNWISSNFPFYKANDDRWKNSVRHNLSINPHFRKGRKSPKGAGHLWCIANTCKDLFTMPLGQTAENTPSFQDVSISEVQAATASIEEDKENRHLPLEDMYYLDAFCDEGGVSLTEETILLEDQDLAHTAGEVLKGVKKDVQVQYVVQQNQKKYIITESDFLNPITLEVAVEESGLNYQPGSREMCDEGTSYLITEINPITLGINMVEGEPITDATDILFCDGDGNINSLTI